MQRLVPAFALCLFLLLIIPTKAQDNQTSTDAAAVRTTVTNYIEAYYTGDAGRMEQTLHPHYLKHMIHGNIPMREKTGPRWCRKSAPTDPATFPVAANGTGQRARRRGNHRLRQTASPRMGQIT